MNGIKYCSACGKLMYSEVFYNHLTGNSFLKYTCPWCKAQSLINDSKKKSIKVKKNGREY